MQATAIPIAITEKPLFVKMPETYETLTKFEITNQRVRHLEGCIII